MRIAYCTNVRLPSERANGHQVASVCEALRKNGHAVHIYCPDRQNVISEDFWTFHDADRAIELTHVPCFDGIASFWTPGISGLMATTRSFTKNLLPLLRENGEFDLLYTRTPEILGMLLEVSKPVVLELHKIPRLFRQKFVERCNACLLIVALTTPMKRELIDLGVMEDRILVEGDAVDLARFDAAPAQSLPELVPGRPSVPVVTYAGSLASMGLEKGVAQMIDALVILKGRGTQCFGLIVGGPAAWVSRYQRRAQHAGLGASDIHCTGRLPQDRIPGILRVSNVLVYPAPASSHPYFMRDTSPLKLFEYMAAGKPIVCADLPPVHDVLNEETAVFFEPGNAESLADGIEHYLLYTNDAIEKAQTARDRVPAYTWECRMWRIMQAVRSNPHKQE